MKNLITFLLYCLSITAMIGQVTSQSRLVVQAPTLSESTIQYTLSGVNQYAVTTEKGTAYVIQIDKGTPMLEAGAPDLPKVAATLMIPAQGNMEVVVAESEFQDFPGVLVAPSKGNLLRTIDPATVPYTFGSKYEHDVFFPQNLVSQQDPFILRDVRGQAFWIHPVQYNPVQKVLRVYTKITIRIKQTATPGINEMGRSIEKGSSRVFRDMYQKLFLNYKPGFVSSSRSVQNPEQLLIIAKDDLVPGLEEYVRWKRQSGIQTTLVSASEVGGQDSSALFNFVKNYYTEYGISYLLLVGDEYSLVPLVRPGSTYSCDNCLGYMEGDDHFPEILVGRFHAANLDQLKIMVQRNLEYEKSPLVDAEANWCATGMASCSAEGQGFGDDSQADYEHGNEWKTKHLADGYEKYWEFYDGDQTAISPTPGDESSDKPTNPENTELVALMNSRGVSLYNYTGHGWEQGLASGNFNTEAVATLRNVHRYPIVIAVACCAGNFTNNGGGDCLGEAFQRAGDLSNGTPYGGIAGLFSSDFQSWSPPMEGQDGMNQYLVDADGVTLHPNLGAMAAFGNALMIAAYGQGGIDMADVWNPFFDPTTVPRTRLPQTLTVNHPAEFVVGSTSLTVACAQEGALVALYQNDQVLAVAYVEGGIASLQFPALIDVSEVTLTVSQFNFIPYQGVLQSASIAGPYVVNQSVVLDDALTGNNNQHADYGETVAFNVSLLNAGGQIANATIAVLSTEDDHVVITDATELFGDLDAGTIKENIAAFTFTVKDDVADGYVVKFKLSISFESGQTLEVPVQVVLQAPKLEVGAFTMLDLQGDGDGRFESGEVATVTIKNLNIGQSKSPWATGKLTTNSPWLSISDAFQLGALDAVTGTADATFYVTIAANAPKVVLAELSYEVNAGNYNASTTFDAFLINPIVEDFESHNFTVYPWVMGGNKPWVITAGNTFTGGYCSRSGTITHNQQSEMLMTLDFAVDGDISFARRVNTEEGFDFLIFSIDGVEIEKWSGDIAWSLVSFPISAGVHTLSWIYKKDEIGNQGFDRVWVDDISMPPYQIVVATNNPMEGDLQATIAPNPSNDRQTWLQVDMPTAQQANLTLYDGVGRIVRIYASDELFLEGKYKVAIDLNGLTPGMYYLEFLSNNSRKMLKLVKSN
jgi:hypothetical protein